MKRTSVNKYLDKARQSVHNGYHNVDGQFQGQSFGREGFSSFAGMPYRNAAGQAAANSGSSQPYIIQITNSSAGAVSSFDVLGSNQYIYGSTGATWNASNSLEVGPVTISSGMPNVTYREMLAQFQQQPFTVGLTYYQSATANQIQEPLLVVTKDANGNESKRPIDPSIDPYQFQGTVLALKDVYIIDGNTKLVINQVLANASITLKLFPADNLNTARALEGKPVSAEYSDPGIIKAQPVVVK